MRFVKALFLKSFVRRLAKSNDTKTTVLGLAAAAVLASQVDFGRLIAGDAEEIGLAAGAVVTALWAYFTNRPDKDAKVP